MIESLPGGLVTGGGMVGLAVDGFGDSVVGLVGGFIVVGFVVGSTSSSVPVQVNFETKIW